MTEAGKSCSQLQGSNYGYQDPSSRYRSIMAYNCETSCTRIQYFSTPSVKLTGTFNNAPIGSYCENNVDQINSARVTVANYMVNGETTGGEFIFRETMGPIRSVLGRCIDVPYDDFSVGRQLFVFDCNGGDNQKWIRPTATDLRLQTQNDMCMDATGNGEVVLSTCDADVDTQQWIYDGRNLRPKYNTGLCLTSQGSDNYANLIVASCDNGSFSEWVEYSMTLTTGPTGYYSANHYLCPVGSYVINISGRSGSWIDQIVMTCNDDSQTVLGPAGGNGGSERNSPNCDSGYSSVTYTRLFPNRQSMALDQNHNLCRSLES